MKNTTRIWMNAIWLTSILLRGIKIFEKLINRNLDNIWNYNCVALFLQEGGEYQLAEKYIREGIKLTKRTKDPEDLLPQLKDMLEEVKQKQKK